MEKTNIPKIIHYCWFGGNPLPDSAKECIESWRRFFPDFEIKCWNEASFDVNSTAFSSKAYAHKKYAFVADVCRMYALYHEGGIYLDTDMLFIKPLPIELLSEDAFVGWENEWEVNVAIFGAKKNALVAKDILSYYERAEFQETNGDISANMVIPYIVTEVLKQKGLVINGKEQSWMGYAKILPASYFYPKDYRTGNSEITTETIAIHLYDATWHSDQKRIDALKSQYEMRLFKAVEDLKKYYSAGDIFSMFYRALHVGTLTLVRSSISKVFRTAKSKLKK